MKQIPRIVIGTIALNEAEWLERLYVQHRDWPGLVRWVFVEGADRAYRDSNPDRVSDLGLSVDGTPGILVDLAKADPRVSYVPHGLARHESAAQGKCALRNRYLEIADRERPDFLVVIDADEFYPRDFQPLLNDLMTTQPRAWGFGLRHREIWWPPCLSRGVDESLGDPSRRFDLEVRGGFWEIPYCRLWRWFPGIRHLDNHNTPSHPTHGSLDRRMGRFDLERPELYYCHLGFASNPESRRAKHRYYEDRGEAIDRRRRWYTESRAAFETWTPETALPNGARVVPYDGIVPECFR